MLQVNFSEGQRPMSKRSKVRVTDLISSITKVHFLLQFIAFLLFKLWLKVETKSISYCQNLEKDTSPIYFSV